MIGLDTNVLVRYIMQDDPEQSPKATELIESLTSDTPGFITMVSVVELYWVLTSAYELSGQQVAQALDGLLRTKQLLMERADQVMRALRVFGAGLADLADRFPGRSAPGAGCGAPLRFDVKELKIPG